MTTYIDLPCLALDSPRWSELEHAYGKAANIPALLRQLADLPSADGEDEPWFTLWSALAHQDDVYLASFAAVPHVVRALASDPARAGAVYFHFPAWVEICRQRRKVTVPADLRTAYAAALAALPALVAKASTRAWDDDMLACALAAIAAVKGFTEVAAAVLELDSEVAGEFMDWFEQR